MTDNSEGPYLPKIGDRVHYHPIRGEAHDGKVYVVRELGQLDHGQQVAWLDGKAGCRAIWALSPAEEDR